MVACYTSPNSAGGASYGAVYKESWPSPQKNHLFVSPLSKNCDQRFRYGKHGSVEAASSNDDAAQKTIEELNLNHKTLRTYRQSAVRGTLGSNYSLSSRKAKIRLRRLKRESGSEITPFYSAIKQALEDHIQRLEYIRQQSG